MSGAVEKYAKKYAKEYVVKEKVILVKNLMANTNFTLDQALNVLGIQGEERVFITTELQES